MDSYEKLRKMSQISKELKKHGLVADANEAIKQAEDMIMSDNKRNQHEVYVTQDSFSKQVNEREARMENEKPKMDAESLKQMHSLFNERFESFNNDLSLIRSKMNEMIAKLNELETKMTSQQRHEVQATLNHQQQQQQHTPAPQRQEQKREEEKPRLRTDNNNNGELKPGDVSIDKIFYVGKR